MTASHDAQAKLKQLGIELPAAGAPAAAYVMAAQTGNQVFLSGHIAKKDGTFMGVLERVHLVDAYLMPDGVRYDERRFNWIGRLVSPTATLFTWHTSRTKKIADLKAQETIVASTGPLSQVEITSRTE